MSKPATQTRARSRPLSPHLTIYRWPITMTMSILHRISGSALYVGTLFVAWWLVTLATSAESFGTADAVMTSWFGLLVLFGFTWALMVHLLGGVRHLIWDTGHGLEKTTASGYAWATLIGSVVLTLAVWAGYFLIAG